MPKLRKLLQFISAVPHMVSPRREGHQVITYRLIHHAKPADDIQPLWSRAQSFAAPHVCLINQPSQHVKA